VVHRLGSVPRPGPDLDRDSIRLVLRHQVTGPLMWLAKHLAPRDNTRRLVRGLFLRRGRGQIAVATSAVAINQRWAADNPGPVPWPWNCPPDPGQGHLPRLQSTPAPGTPRPTGQGLAYFAGIIAPTTGSPSTHHHAAVPPLSTPEESAHDHFGFASRPRTASAVRSDPEASSSRGASV